MKNDIELKGTEVLVTFIGTGAAIPQDDRNHASIALSHNSGTILFDCGEASQFQLRKYKVSTRKEFIIAITHLHLDHFQSRRLNWRNRAGRRGPDLSHR